MKGPFDWPGRSDRDDDGPDPKRFTGRATVLAHRDIPRECGCCTTVENDAECNCDPGALCVHCNLCPRHCGCGDAPGDDPKC